MVRMEMVIQNELEPWNQMPKDGIQKTPFVRFGSAAPNMSLPDRSLIKKPSCGSKSCFNGYYPSNAMCWDESWLFSN